MQNITVGEVIFFFCGGGGAFRATAAENRCRPVNAFRFATQTKANTDVRARTRAHTHQMATPLPLR